MYLPQRKGGEEGENYSKDLKGKMKEKKKILGEGEHTNEKLREKRIRKT